MLAFAIAGMGRAQVTRLVANDSDGWNSAISANGRFVAFESSESLVPGDTNHRVDVYVRDMTTGIIGRASVSSRGDQADGDCVEPSLSADGRFVTFSSASSTLVDGDTAGFVDVFVGDRRNGTTQRVSVAASGAEADGNSSHPRISADGSSIVFTSAATNLVRGDANSVDDVFVHDLRTGATERASVSWNGDEADGKSYAASISADGRYVVFSSDATNLFAGDLNWHMDVFIRDRELRTTRWVSNVAAYNFTFAVDSPPSVSADGRYVAFDWALCDIGCPRWIYLRDVQLGTIELLTTDPAGSPSSGEAYNPYITPDGRYVVFDSGGSDLVPGDTNGSYDVFLWDRESRSIERLSVSSQGAQGDFESGAWWFGAAGRASDDGRFVVFSSSARTLVPEFSGYPLVYVRERAHAEPPLLCSPGFSGVAGCPCSNPASTRERGCDSSAGTGGARLHVLGGEYVSSDSLYFTVTDAKPEALTVIFQSTRPKSGGAVLGQGVRCAGGVLEALYSARSGRDGSLTVPDFAAGDPTVHARAAAAGDPILPMQTRWYMALYRDPIVLGGCPATATFNTTPTSEVLWLP